MIFFNTDFFDTDFRRISISGEYYNDTGNEVILLEQQ